MKKYRIRLPELMVEAPQWWQNFTAKTPTKILRNGALIEHGARFVIHRMPDPYNSDEIYSIEFNSPEDATLFVIKWS